MLRIVVTEHPSVSRLAESFGNGGQAELVRVPRADFSPIKLEGDLPDERYLYLSDILPTAWQGVKYADVRDGGSLVILGWGRSA